LNDYFICIIIFILKNILFDRRCPSPLINYGRKDMAMYSRDAVSVQSAWTISVTPAGAQQTTPRRDALRGQEKEGKRYM
jgi:hypothetical protein